MFLLLGKFTGSTAARLTKKRAFEKKRKQAERSFKRGRLLKKPRKRNTLRAAEVRECPTYQTEVGHLQEVDLNEIPVPAVQKPLSRSTGPLKKVFFDLETTGSEHNAYIVQIAALYGEECFELYILPPKELKPNGIKSNPSYCTK
ncbi:uncharacterized protein LOC128549454 [Mercenaria mercenaria]|uniref:uncharacterized protein LOC128549454 n=1 Tax=Mercenaria mercenaria TaxID=6596 RepID=UPI00234FA0D5|nr:uncharacterized protein LOC128549454 [Mercenaria mercenaria]